MEVRSCLRGLEGITPKLSGGEAVRWSAWLGMKEAPMLTDHEDRDCAMRALNNAAIAKNCLLAGNLEEAARHLDVVLSWNWSLLGAKHPMAGVAVHVLQPPLLNHADTSHLAQNT